MIIDVADIIVQADADVELSVVYTTSDDLTATISFHGDMNVNDQVTLEVDGRLSTIFVEHSPPEMASGSSANSDISSGPMMFSDASHVAMGAVIPTLGFLATNAICTETVSVTLNM